MASLLLLAPRRFRLVDLLLEFGDLKPRLIQLFGQFICMDREISDVGATPLQRRRWCC
jgi:hypothetical protein